MGPNSNLYLTNVIEQNENRQPVIGCRACRSKIQNKPTKWVSYINKGLRPKVGGFLNINLWPKFQMLTLRNSKFLKGTPHNSAGARMKAGVVGSLELEQKSV